MRSALSTNIAGMDRNARIVVIGGGAAGLSAAWYLEKAGFTKVTVLERAARVGGKCETITIPDGRGGTARLDMGALEVTADYDDVLAIGDAVGAARVPEVQRRFLDIRRTIRVAVRRCGLFEILTLPLDAYRYRKLLDKYETWLESPGFANMPDPDLAMPFRQYLKKHRMESIAPLFDVAITAYGYGALGTIPTCYVMKYISKTIFKLMVPLPVGMIDVQKWPQNFADGFGGLWQKVAPKLRDVRTGVTIESVTRGDVVKVAMTAPEGARVEEFDAMILACPLHLGALSFLDVTPAEAEVFGKVNHKRYCTIAAEVKGLEVGFAEAPPDVRNGHVVQFFKPYPEADVAVFYVNASEEVDWTDIDRNFPRDIAALGKHVRLVKVHEKRTWDYFPHFSPEELRWGAYDRIDALQGQRKSFYTGGLLNMETVKTAVICSKGLVERFFVDDTSARVSGVVAKGSGSLAA